MGSTENDCYSNFVPRFPEHVQETIAKRPLKKQQELYLDIYKHLDFYELLFEHFKKQGKTEISSGNKETSSNDKDTDWRLSKKRFHQFVLQFK